MPTTRNIPFFNYTALFASQERELMAVMRDVMGRGAYILQKDIFEFEESLRRFLNVKHAITLADGTNALKLALLAVGVGPGDEVIVPAHTYIASAASIHFVGATPVLCECGPDHMIDAESARQRITSRTKAIMPVQLNGRTADMDKVMALAAEHKLHVVEDAAQALGSKFKGRFAGTFGAAGTFSFYPAKVLGCFGDGGGLVTNDDEVARKVRLLRDHGRDEEGEVVAWGTNCRLDNIQAAVLNFKFKTFPLDLERRRAIAQIYERGLRDVQELVLPPGPDADPRHHDIFQNYEIEAQDRDALKSHLQDCGIRTIVQFGGKAVHQFSGLEFKDVSLPVTERMYTRFLLLPMNTTLTDDDAQYIVETIRSFYGRKG